MRLSSYCFLLTVKKEEILPLFLYTTLFNLQIHLDADFANAMHPHTSL